jgi:hypothetical protein
MLCHILLLIEEAKNGCWIIGYLSDLGISASFSFRKLITLDGSGAVS